MWAYYKDEEHRGTCGVSVVLGAPKIGKSLGGYVFHKLPAFGDLLSANVMCRHGSVSYMVRLIYYTCAKQHYYSCCPFLYRVGMRCPRKALNTGSRPTGSGKAVGNVDPFNLVKATGSEETLRVLPLIKATPVF